MGYYVTAKEVVELPPLRFVRESATVAGIVMEATVIDVPGDWSGPAGSFPVQPDEEDLRTEADFEELSALEALAIEEVCSILSILPLNFSSLFITRVDSESMRVSSFSCPCKDPATK